MPSTLQNCTSPIGFVAQTCCSVVGGRWMGPLCETENKRMFVACSDGMAAANKTLANAHGGCTGGTGSGRGKKSSAVRARVGVLALVWVAAATVCAVW